MNDRAIIDKLFTIAGYTYGPLLGLFTFGLFTKRSVNDRMTPWIAIASPVICYFLSMFSEELFNGYRFGFEMLLVNGFPDIHGAVALQPTGMLQSLPPEPDREGCRCSCLIPSFHALLPLPILLCLGLTITLSSCKGWRRRYSIRLPLLYPGGIP